MSRWREIMASAEQAKSTMIGDRASGEAAFASLLTAYPNDGMVYLKRGEAFEVLGDLESALADYELAHRLLPMPSWKNTAVSAIARVSGRTTNL